MFYTYLWLREDGTPWYVGKGSGRRAWQRNKSHWAPKDHSKVSVQYWSDEATAFAYEIYLIDFWGRKDSGTGCLRNLSDGGENPPNHTGLKRTKETKEAVGNIHRGKVVSQETREKIRRAIKGRVSGNKGSKGKQIAWNKGLHGVQKSWSQGLKTPLEVRQKQSISAKRRDPHNRRGPKGPWSPARREAQDRKNAKRKNL